MCKHHSVLIYLLAFITWIQCSPQNPDIILAEFRTQNEEGYKFLYEISNGIKREETGTISQKDNKEVLRVTGSYSFIGFDGEEHHVIFVADENGYRPVSFKGKKPEMKTIFAPPVIVIGSATIASLIGGGMG